MRVGSWQLAVSSWQLAVGGWQLTVGGFAHRPADGGIAKVDWRRELRSEKL
jgi:hypothetical protein